MVDERILMGTSNICCFYDADIFKDFRPYKFKPCVNLAMFKAEMAHLTSDNKYVILSVIENVLEDVIKTAQNNSSEDESEELKDERIMEAVVMSIKEAIEVVDQVGKDCLT